MQTGKLHTNVDCLSRYPTQETLVSVAVTLSLEDMEGIKSAQALDAQISKLSQGIKDGYILKH